MNNEIELVEGQVVEVEFNPELVKEYQDNYIMEEEGIGADPDVTPYDEQTTFNEDSLDELFDPEDSEVEEMKEGE